MFKKIREGCAICSEGFSVQVENSPVDGVHVKYTEKSKIYTAEASEEQQGLLVSCNSIKRIDNPYPDGMSGTDKIMQNMSRALEFLEIDHQFV